MHLDRILEGLEVSTSAIALCGIHGDARHLFNEGDETAILYILDGNGFGWQVSGQTVELFQHSVIIIPSGTEISITCHQNGNWDDAEPLCKQLPEDWVSATVGNGEPAVKLACAYLNAQHMQTVGLFDYLHEPMVINLADEDSFKRPFKMLMDEMAAPKPGTKALTEILMKQCLISILRRQLEPNGEFSGPWLAAVINPALSKAIAAIVDNPARPHTVSTLADTANMSRTAFSEQFRELTGRTPIDLLKEIRLRKAIRLLTSTDLPIKTIAARVGFSSRSYFSMVFKSFTGVGPANYREEPVRYMPQPSGGSF